MKDLGLFLPWMHRENWQIMSLFYLQILKILFVSGRKTKCPYNWHFDSHSCMLVSDVNINLNAFTKVAPD